MMARSSDMGELLDALNELDERAAAPDKPVDSFVDVAAQIFRAASRTVNGAIEVLLEPNMPLDMLGRWTRRAPLPALAIAFLGGVRVARRPRGQNPGGGNSNVSGILPFSACAQRRICRTGSRRFGLSSPHTKNIPVLF